MRHYLKQHISAEVKYSESFRLSILWSVVVVSSQDSDSLLEDCKPQRFWALWENPSAQIKHFAKKK